MQINVKSPKYGDCKEQDTWKFLRFVGIEYKELQITVTHREIGVEYSGVSYTLEGV